MSTKISIAMTTYNGEDYLPAQLESFASQARLPDELVACDDGSTDRTIEVLEAFAESVPFEVRIVRNASNLGHERNFSQAVDLCTGDIIFLADQDDAWYPEKIQIVEQVFGGDPKALVVINDVLITDDKLVPTGRTVLGQTRAAGFLGANAKGLTLGCATAFRSRLRRLIAPIPALDYGHDSWIHDFTEVLGGRRVVPQVLQLYRRHGANASNWVFNGSARATPFAVMRQSAGKDLTPEYAKRIRALTLMLERVQALGPEAYSEIHPRRDYDAVVRDLRRAIAAVERRGGVFRRGWMGRKALALQLLLRGDYRYFFGWRSFAKDLVR
jgi:glycosyltransferase involved in cell wall biosynthesis